MKKSKKTFVEKIKSEDYSFYYNGKPALKNINISFPDKMVTSIVGPSGCGKTTLLRSINRLNDLIPKTTFSGDIFLDGISIFDKGVSTVLLRRKVGMIFQKSNPFPKSIFDNIAFGIKVNNITNDKHRIEFEVEQALKISGLWSEVKDNLSAPAMGLSGGQQQRLCLARALAVKPEILLLDEPAGALDPASTSKIEELIHTIKKTITIVIVTHNLQQAARLSDYTAFILSGELVEFDKTTKIFTNPSVKQTEDYVTGRFG